MTVLHAQPYDITAQGFFFRSAREYDQRARQVRIAAGQPVEEFEIQFIDGDDIDCALASALGLNQCNFAEFFELTCSLDEDDKLRLIIALGECGYHLTPEMSPDDFDIDLYELDSMHELAEQFVDEGLMGDVPENLLWYFDYDALARDLSIDYSEIEIAGKRYIYRCS